MRTVGWPLATRGSVGWAGVERVRPWAELSSLASGDLGGGRRISMPPGCESVSCRTIASSPLSWPLSSVVIKQRSPQQSHERTRQDPLLASNGRFGVLVCALGLAAALLAPRSRRTSPRHKSHHSDSLPGHGSSPGPSCKRAYPYLRIASNPIGADLAEGIVSAEGGRWNKRCICIISYYDRSPSLFRRMLIWGCIDYITHISK